MGNGFERLTGRAWVMPDEPARPRLWDAFLATAVAGLVLAAGGAFDALWVALAGLP
jgi:hypothetical protein